MDISELVEERESVQAALNKSNIAQKCAAVAVKFGTDRDSKQRDFYINYDYLFRQGGLEIDCNIGQNMYGDGWLTVKRVGKIVLNVSSSYPHRDRHDLPLVRIWGVGHRVIGYEPGHWEDTVEDLFSEI